MTVMTVMISLPKNEIGGDFAFLTLPPILAGMTLISL